MGESYSELLKSGSLPPRHHEVGEETSGREEISLENTGVKRSDASERIPWGRWVSTWASRKASLRRKLHNPLRPVNIAFRQMPS